MTALLWFFAYFGVGLSLSSAYLWFGVFSFREFDHSRQASPFLFGGASLIWPLMILWALATMALRSTEHGVSLRKARQEALEQELAEARQEVDRLLRGVR